LALKKRELPKIGLNLQMLVPKMIIINFLNAGPLSNLDKYYGKDNEFWQQLKDHSSYDDFGRNVEFYSI
jgi:hypothetical protein